MKKIPLTIILSIIIPLILWSTHSVFGKYLLTQGTGVFELNFYRSIGALLTVVFLLNWRRIMQYPARYWIPGSIMLINFITFNYALKYIDAYIVMVLEASCFVFCLIFDRYLIGKVFVSIPSLLLFFVGIALLLYQAFSSQHEHIVLGLAFAIVTSIIFGLFNSTLYLMNEAKPIDRFALTILPLLIVSFPFAMTEIPQSTLGWNDIVLVIFVAGFLQTAVPMYLWLQSAQYFSGSILSILFLLTIPGTFFNEWLWLGLEFDWLKVIASLILLASVLIYTVQLHRHKAMNTEAVDVV